MQRAPAGVDHRHPGRRPARPHAGAGRGAARLQVPHLQRRRTGPPRRRGCDDARRLRGLGKDRSVRGGSRRRHLRVRERAGRGRRGGRAHHAGAARASRRSRWRRTGSRRSASSRRLGIPVAPFAAVAGPDDFAAAIARGRRAGDPQDAPPRLRRQGPGAHRRRPASSPRRSRPSAARRQRSRRFVDFECEVSVLLVRSLAGEIALLRHPDQPPRGRHPAHLDRAVAHLPPAHRGARPRDRRHARRRARLRRRAGGGDVLRRRRRPSRCSSTSSPRACTTAATGPSTPAPSASSRTTSAPSPAGRWARPSAIRTAG